MSFKIHSIFNSIGNLLFPSICQGCGGMGSYLCVSCIKDKINFVKEQKCHVCKKCKNLKLKTKNFSSLVHKECAGKTYLDGVIVVAEYSKFVENYLGDIKYEFYFAMIPDLIKAINKYLEKNVYFQKLKNKSILTSVPLHPYRKRWRGFNQAEKIAEGVGLHFNIPDVKLLSRKRRTKSQVGLKRGERLSNLQGAFSVVDKEKITINQYNKIVLVDDVMTSGATLEECGRVLKDAGCETVYGLVFARG